MIMNIGDFGRFIPQSDADVHPENLAQVKSDSEKLKWKIYELTSKSDEFATFQCGDCVLRGRLSAFTPLPRRPKYRVGSRVNLRESGAEAVVSDMQWHRVKDDYIYILTLGGRESSKWYFETDLI